ncbi:PucR family transcriptional regulator ligand-binding domain-containing protein [Saccharopolyspora oryzae]|uniref:PucR family transcriptional regulator ligand-binding domain-containing protein n=1 Tax=Saccharopolyspora oryzae TaxID=2997343 RepID=A0ABT4V9Y0_9PSEU|nr:PucR family transcriptional regulator ligand-binding domain-containing protein [Saccharopolyspora oryzae]MDA3630779.1 PucR family transcriptional regulator ligand-binding domain-containing protein [Saccharopolyspora oryzae]
MSIPLSDVLRHPSLCPADPVLLAGDDSRPVRWVHSSEVVELAHLLRGGELVLTAAMVLTTASDEQQRRYIQQLVEHDVTAVAVERAEELPAALVDEARKRDFALVQLRRTVPFVEVAEGINGLLINASVSRLRLADSLSDQLSEQLISGGDLPALVNVLATWLNARVSVQDPTGHVLAVDQADGMTELGTAHEAPIAVHGIVTATLRIEPLPGADADLLDAALDRAPPSFALALQRSHPAGPEDTAAHAFFQALERSDTTPETSAELVGATALGGACAHVAVVMPAGGPFRPVEQAVRHRGRPVLSRAGKDERLSIVALPGNSPERARHQLIEDILAHTPSQDCTVAIGPLARNPHRIRHSVTEARRCLLLRPELPDSVIDANIVAVRRLVHRLDARDVLHDFVEEQLGGLLEQQPETSRRLLETLVAFFDCDSNRTATASRLHLQRQTLYHRLDKITRALGHDITDSRTAPAFQIAVRLWQAMQPPGA